MEIRDTVIPIAIINWNGYEDTVECVESVLEMSKEVKYEVYLLDNNSSNNEYTRLKETFNSYEFIHIYKSETNIGFTHGSIFLYKIILEQGIKSPYVVLLNNDTIVDSEWLKTLYNYAEAGRWDVISSKMVQYYNRTKLDNLGHDMLRSGEIIPMNHNKPIDSKPRKLSKNSQNQNFGACGGAAMYRTSMLDRIGFFDPYFDTGYEDAEMGFRAFVTGYRIGLCEKALVYHKGGVSIKKVFNEDYAVKTQRNVLYTIKKLYSKSLLLLCGIPLLIRYLILTTFAVLLFKSQIAKVMVRTFIEFIKIDSNIANSSIFNKLRSIKKTNLVGMQKSIFIHDLNRIFSIMVQRKFTSLEVYR